MADRYDAMTTAELLAEMCRKLDRIEAQGALKVTVTGQHRDTGAWGEVMRKIHVGEHPFVRWSDSSEAPDVIEIQHADPHIRSML